MGKYIKNILKTILAAFVLEITAFSCTVIKPLPIQDTTAIQYRYIDSIIYRDSIIFHNIYKEYYKDYSSLLDTLNMTTTYSESKSWVDTTNKILKGELKNKEDSIPIKIKWKEKIVYKDSLVYIKEEVPVEVEKIVTKHPKYEIYLWMYLVFSILVIACMIFIKLKS